MKELGLHILPDALLGAYCHDINPDLESLFGNLEDAEISTDSFSFYTSVSSVFSSKIEGENIDLDSYVKHKRYGIAFSPDYTKKIDDLYNAYVFAQESALNQANIEKAHAMLASHFLAVHQQGKIRTQNMYVTTSDGRIEYVAAPPAIVGTEMEKFYADIDVLVSTDLNIQEAFFFASLIHLVFVKIHPFDDGNGRTARLLEKWFLAQKLGNNAWFLASERYYYRYHQAYYNNIRALGLEYENLDFGKALPFLAMLPQSLMPENNE